MFQVRNRAFGRAAILVALAAFAMAVASGCGDDPKGPDPVEQEEPEYLKIPITLIDFGEVKAGTEKEIRSELTNLGDEELLVYAKLEGADASAFQVCLGSTDEYCEGMEVIPAGTSVPFIARFLTEEPGLKTARAVLSDGGMQTFGEISLIGAAVSSGPSLDCAPDSLDFGTVTIGDSVSRTIACTNSGSSLGEDDDRLMIEAIHLGHASFAWSILDAQGVTEPKAEGYAPGEGFTIAVVFTPSSEGVESGAIVLETPAAPGGSHAIELTGKGQAPCTWTDEYTWPAPPGRQAEAFPRYFVLRRMPFDRNDDGIVDADDIDLTVEGEPVAPTLGDAEIWSFDADSARIDFMPLHLPAEGAELTATYLSSCD